MTNYLTAINAWWFALPEWERWLAAAAASAPVGFVVRYAIVNGVWRAVKWAVCLPVSAGKLVWAGVSKLVRAVLYVLSFKWLVELEEKPGERVRRKYATYAGEAIPPAVRLLNACGFTASSPDESVNVKPFKTTRQRCVKCKNVTEHRYWDEDVNPRMRLSQCVCGWLTMMPPPPVMEEGASKQAPLPFHECNHFCVGASSLVNPCKGCGKTLDYILSNCQIDKDYLPREHKWIQSTRSDRYDCERCGLNVHGPVLRDHGHRIDGTMAPPAKKFCSATGCYRVAASNRPDGLCADCAAVGLLAAMNRNTEPPPIQGTKLYR